jgi:hypothetical protein
VPSVNCPSCQCAARLWRCPKPQISGIFRAVPPRPEGRYGQSSRNVERDAMDAGCVAGRAARSWTAKSCGPGAPWLALSWRRCFGIAPMTVTKKSWTPGRARRKPLKPLARGMPERSDCTCGDYARVLFYFAREAAGAAGARHSLRPLSIGGDFCGQLGRFQRREKASLCFLRMFCGRGGQRRASRGRPTHAKMQKMRMFSGHF